MNNKLDIYHSILFLKLRPLRNRNVPQIKYKELLKEIKAESYQFQPCYEVDFFPPHTEMAKYYRSLIKNEAIRYYNHTCSLINESSDNDVKQLWVKSTLNDILSDKFTEVASEIERLNYSISHIDPKQNHKLKDITLSQETYVYQYLKFQLIQLYLDIQEAFESYLITDKLSEEDIHLQFFKEPKLDQLFIKESEKIEMPIVTNTKKEKSSFKPIYEDIQPIHNSKADYSIIYNQQLFGEVEAQLYEYDIIGIDYFFKKSKKHSNHTLLAATFKVLIENNYFRRNIIGSHQKLKDTDIRKYLDERYSVDTSQQFRRITDEQIEQAKIKLPWLDKIRRIS